MVVVVGCVVTLAAESDVDGDGLTVLAVVEISEDFPTEDVKLSLPMTFVDVISRGTSPDVMTAADDDVTTELSFFVSVSYVTSETLAGMLVVEASLLAAISLTLEVSPTTLSKVPLAASMCEASVAAVLTVPAPPSGSTTSTTPPLLPTSLLPLPFPVASSIAMPDSVWKEREGFESATP